MATLKKRKDALKAAVYGFVAGAHALTEEVERSGALKSGQTEEMIELRREMLRADYKRFFESLESAGLLVDVLNEENLFPYASDWNVEALQELLKKVIPPKLRLEETSEEPMIRFKKGFKEILADLAENLESDMRKSSGVDHWMVQILNSAFHAGQSAAIQYAENTKIYLDARADLDSEIDPWNRFPQIEELLDSRLRNDTRRKSGLVSDFDF